MGFNIFSTLNQNLQNLWGDAYDAYQSWKSKVGNVASTINNNLQNFGGDLYDAGNQIKNNVSNFATQSVNTGKQVANQISSNVSNFANETKKSILAPADRFMTDVTKIGNARKATEYGLNNKDKDALMSQMLDEWTYSDEDIIQAVNQLDAEEKARKQKEFSDWQSGNKANANIGQKALAWALNLWGGTIAGIGQWTLGIADFATGGKFDTLKQEKQAYDQAIANNGWAFTVGKNIGQIGASLAAPWLGKLAPSGTWLAATAGRGAVYGGVYGAANPIMEKGSDATMSDIWTGAVGGAVTGAIAWPILEKVVAPTIGKLAQSATSWFNAAKFANGNLGEKIGAWVQWTAKNLKRWVAQLYNKTNTSATQNVAKLYGLQNEEIGALKQVGEKKTSAIIDKMDALDEQALAGGWVGNIYDDLHGSIMKWIQNKSSELSKLENTRKSIVNNSPIQINQKELEQVFDNAIAKQGVQRVNGKYKIVWEWRITEWDISKLDSLRSDILRGDKKVLTANDLDARIKNLQQNLYNKDGTPVLGSESVSKTWEWIVSDINSLLKSKLPKEYGAIKQQQSDILNTRKLILKKLGEEDNTIANLTNQQIENMSDKEVTQLINDSIAGNKMGLFLRRLASSTTTGGDAKQLANIIKNFTWVDAESEAIALRAIAKMTGKNQIYNELGGILEKWPIQAATNLLKRGAKATILPSDKTVVKAVSKIKPSIIKKK